jgi:hypothetical protein
MPRSLSIPSITAILFVAKHPKISLRDAARILNISHPRLRQILATEAAHNLLVNHGYPLRFTELPLAEPDEAITVQPARPELPAPKEITLDDILGPVVDEK